MQRTNWFIDVNESYMGVVSFLFQLSMFHGCGQGGDQDSQEVKLGDQPGISFSSKLPNIYSIKCYQHVFFRTKLSACSVRSQYILIRI